MSRSGSHVPRRRRGGQRAARRHRGAAPAQPGNGVHGDGPRSGRSKSPLPCEPARGPGRPGAHQFEPSRVVGHALDRERAFARSRQQAQIMPVRSAATAPSWTEGTAPSGGYAGGLSGGSAAGWRSVRSSSRGGCRPPTTAPAGRGFIAIVRVHGGGPPGPGAGGQCGPSCQMPMTLPAGSRIVATRRFPSG